MLENFVEVYATDTGNKQMVPRHFLDNPVLSRGLKLTPAGRVAYDVGTAAPSLDWTREELDTHAEKRGLDTAGLANKHDVLAAINGDGPQSSPETGSVGFGDGTEPGAAHNPTIDDPAAGDEE